MWEELGLCWWRRRATWMAIAVGAEWVAVRWRHETALRLLGYGVVISCGGVYGY